MGQGRTGAADSPYHSGPYRAQDKGDGDEKSREILTLSPMIAIEQEQLIAELEASNEALRRLQEKVGDIDEKVSNLSSWPTLDGEESDRLAKDASKLDTELHATEEHLKLLGKDMQEYSPQNPEKP
jgi:peptidoglycan hydrolase CwlO-like protein